MTWRLISLGLMIFAATTIASDSGSGFTAEQRNHWAWRTISRVTVPQVRDLGAAPSAVDGFILDRLQREGVRPAPPASRAALLRRVSLDLTGIPPTISELETFERDESPGAFSTVVERLLASPQYGERMARHWLDLARFAESEGFKADETRPNAWRYRDYVIRSFNADKPYDRFVQEQLAGDELWPDDPDALVATGFNRHYPDESNARNLMQRRQEILNDITDTAGSVFLGLTLACARCHDHKWDPITQADYFRFQAYFANTAAADAIPLLPPDALKAYQTKLGRWEEATRSIREEMALLEAPHREAIIKDYVDKYPDNIQVALRKPAGARTAFEAQMVAKAKLYIDPSSHQYIASTATVVKRMKKEDRERWQALKDQLAAHDAIHPGSLPLGTGVKDLGREAPATHLLRRGNWDAPKEELAPGFLSIFGGTLRSCDPVPGAGTSGRRTALARTLTDPAHPLTARVMVNRIWQMHFGRGLVGSPGDFGLRGERPTHPELLDWLSREFVRSGWSIKHMHRVIVNTGAYQRSSRNTWNEPAASVDADTAAAPAGDGTSPGANSAGGRGMSGETGSDSLYAWYPRHRLEGEIIRDSALAVSGRMNWAMGGPGIFPELPPGMESRGGWPVNRDTAERDRRSIYVFVRRNTRYPMFEAFDMPDTHESCGRRNVTTSPVQALTLLNSRLTHEWARGFAGRVVAMAGTAREGQIETAWRMAYGRRPDDGEMALALEFLERQAGIVAERLASGAEATLPDPYPAGAAPSAGAALTDLCHALLNSNEFVYRN